MKKIVMGILAVAAMQPIFSQSFESFFKPSLVRASYYPGENNYIIKATSQQFNILDVEANTVKQVSNSSKCASCMPQLFHNGFILLENKKGMYANIYAIDGQLLDRKLLTSENEGQERYNQVIPSKNGKYALFTGTKTGTNPNQGAIMILEEAGGVPFSYSAISADGNLLWYLKKKDLEVDLKNTRISATAIDDEGNTYFVQEPTGNTQQVVYVTRINPSGEKAVKQLSFETSGNVISYSGITLGTDGKVLVYGNYYHSKAASEDLHGFFYALVSFDDQSEPETAYYAYPQNGKYDYLGKKIYGYLAEDGGFYFVHEVIWKTTGSGDDDPKVNVLRLDKDGTLLKELSYGILLYEANSLEIINALQMDNKIFVTYFSGKSKSEKKHKLTYVILNKDLEEEKTGVIAEVSYAAISQWNCDARKWGKYAIIEGAGLNVIYDKIAVE